MAHEIKLQEPRPGYYRIERLHPVTQARLILCGKNPERIVAQAHRLESLRLDLRAGIITAEQAKMTAADVIGGLFTVRQAWERYFATVKASSTRRTYHTAWKMRLEQEFGDLACVELTKGTLDAWVADQVRKGKEPKTIAHAWDALRAALKLAITDGRLMREPWGDFSVKVKKQKTIKKELPRSIEEFQQLILVAAEHDAKLRATGKGERFGDLAIRIIIAGLLGLRQGELGALGWDDIITQRGAPTVRVRHSVRRNWHIEHPDWERPKHPTKTGEISYLPLHIDAYKALMVQKKYLEERGWYRPDGPVFPGKGGKWRTSPRTINPEKIRELVEVAIPGADVEKFSPHSLRHMHAGLTLVSARGDMDLTMAQTRHSDLKVMRMYLHTMGRGVVGSPIPEIGLPYSTPAKALPQGDVQEAEFEDNAEWQKLPDGRWANAITGEIEVEGFEPPLFAENSAIVIKNEVPALVDVAEATAQKAKQFHETAKAARRQTQNEISARYKASNATDFLTALGRWNAKGRPGERPTEVTAAANGAYQRCYRNVIYRKEQGRFSVQRDTRSWEAIVRQILGIAKGGEVPAGKVSAIRRVNGNEERPPKPGNMVALPPELEAVRRGKRARRAVIMAWAKFLKDANAKGLSPSVEPAATEEPEMLDVDAPPLLTQGQHASRRRKA